MKTELSGIKKEKIGGFDALDASVRDGMSFLSSGRRVVRKLGILELSSGAVKLLVGRIHAGTDVSHFDFSRFLRFSVRTSTSSGIDSSGRMDMDFYSRRVLPEVWEMLSKAKALGVDMLCAVATAAYRNAINISDISDCLKAGCGIGISVLSQSEEAMAVSAAVSGTLPHCHGRNVCIIDQGGRSTEITFGGPCGTDIYEIDSGSENLIRSFDAQIASLSEKTIADMTDHISKEITHICDDYSCACGGFGPACNIVGVGSAITLATGLRGCRNIHGCRLSVEYLGNMYSESLRRLKNSEFDEREREGLLLRSLGLRRYLDLTNHTGSGAITVSGAGLWYGVFFRASEMLANRYGI